MNNDNMSTKRQAGDNEDDTDLMRDLPDDQMEDMQQGFSEESGDEKTNP